MSGTILGMHVQRGQLDAVETFFTAADIAEGVAVKLTAADTVAAVSAASDNVIGIAGGKRTGVGIAVVRHGKFGPNWQQVKHLLLVPLHMSMLRVNW